MKDDELLNALKQTRNDNKRLERYLTALIVCTLLLSAVLVWSTTVISKLPILAP